jgi:subtilisin family serine protease
MSLRLSLVSVLLALTGCTAPNTSDTTAITNRPQQYDQIIAIIRLKNPPALATASKDAEGNNVLNPDDLQRIEAEQTAMLATLTAMSDKIEVLNRYKLVLNGITILAPRELEEKLRTLASTSYVEREQRFMRLRNELDDEPANSTAANFPGGVTSTSFIGATDAHAALGITGAGTTVGVIDTGIDYTHAMFGGAGTEDAFRTNNPDVVEDGTFPTAKVVGGIDLVGKEYDSGSPIFGRHIPKPDADPIDEGGHGSHVAGTVAGLGDGTNSYTGVAPNALLHSIKVFGADGSTGDAVIIASLEYAADPNGDGTLSDQLDVVNLSLGSGYGTPHILYSEAMKNLASSGTITVASAGNSGHDSYIVGAPGTTAEAISVAASIDGMDHNWKFDASRLTLGDGTSLLVEAVEAPWAKPVDESDGIGGTLVYIGLAAAPLPDDLRQQLNGNVALIDRGQVAFCEKAKNATDAGATGIVVANNVPGNAFIMGGDCSYNVPAIMVSQNIGDQIKARANAGASSIVFKSGDKIEKPELVDTLTAFSSRGPRSIDALIKPEVAAPGYNITSAKMGGGVATARLNGTSMAAPHVAGLAALVKERFPALTPAESKSVIVNQAKLINDEQGQQYPVAMQGAGRIDAMASLQAKIVAIPSTISLGAILVEQSKTVRQELSIKALDATVTEVSLEVIADEGLAVQVPATVATNSTFTIKATITPQFGDAASKELDGFVLVKNGEATLAKIPLLAVARKAARISASSVAIAASSPADAAGAVASVTLTNAGKTSGQALPFNLLASDQRKDEARQNSLRNPICDLQSVGYRVIEKDSVKYLQVGVKLYNPVTTWHLCEISIQIDANGDGKADQELLGTYAKTLTENAAQNNMFLSILTDAEKMRSIRTEYEQNWPAQTTQNYTAAIVDTQDFKFYDQGTIAVVTADVSKLAQTANGDLQVKVAVLTDISSPESDDFVADHQNRWKTLSLDADGAGFVQLPETIDLAAGATQSIEFVKGGGSQRLLMLLPHNQSNESAVRADEQQKILRNTYN